MNWIIIAAGGLVAYLLLKKKTPAQTTVYTTTSATIPSDKTPYATGLKQPPWTLPGSLAPKDASEDYLRAYDTAYDYGYSGKVLPPVDLKRTFAASPEDIAKSNDIFNGTKDGYSAGLRDGGHTLPSVTGSDSKDSDAQVVILYPMSQLSVVLPSGLTLNGVRLSGDSMHSAGATIKKISVGPMVAYSSSVYDSKLPKANIVSRWDGFDILIDRNALESIYGKRWNWHGPITVTLISGKGGRVYLQRL